MSTIQVQALHKKYNGLHAVRGISFSVEKGEVFGFLGPNGAGKTSTINMLTGLARPSSGTITIHGMDALKHTKDIQSRIGVVPDESNLYDDLSGLDNLSFCASLYGMKKADRIRKARELLASFSLDAARDRPFRTYSKGMKRKLTIAAAIIHEPEILFLDEPTSGIDVESARQIRRLIRSLHDQGVTIFLTTHYIEDAERLCDRIAFIVEGVIVETDTVSALLSRNKDTREVAFKAVEGGRHLHDAVKQRWPDVTIRAVSAEGIRVVLEHETSIMPFLKLFESCGFDLLEARIIHQSLEDVFVSITGIDIDRLEKAREAEST